MNLIYLALLLNYMLKNTTQISINITIYSFNKKNSLYYKLFLYLTSLFISLQTYLPSIPITELIGSIL